MLRASRPHSRLVRRAARPTANRWRYARGERDVFCLNNRRNTNPTHVGARQLKPFVRGSWGAEFHADLQPQPGDVIVGEHWLHSGFSNTDLDYQLRNHGVDHIILAGMRGNACIEATARYGVELGYHVTLVKDATAAFSHAEWSATMEVNAPAFAHAIVTTAEIVAALARS